MVTILFAQFADPLPGNLFEQHLTLLPDDEQSRNRRFVRWQDRHLHLLGKLLLIDGLKMQGFDGTTIHKINYTATHKPLIEAMGVYFNISHSGNIAVCSISNEVETGIDIEAIKEVTISDFKSVFTPREWEKIHISKDKIKEFYNLWTRKESVIKADGRGLQIPLNKIEVIDDSVIYENREWFIKPLIIADHFASNIATNKADVPINICKKAYY